MSYLTQIRNYQPINEQEAVDQAAFLAFMKNNPDHLLRSNLAGHVTVSAFVCNPELTHVLFAYHNIYQSWSWVGGHLDGETDLLGVAIKEAKEETGLHEVTPLMDDIFILDVIQVMNHYKNGAYVGDHLHFNVTYLLIGDPQKPVFPKLDENQGVKWFSWEDVFTHVSEPRMIPIYQKAYTKIKQIKENV